MPWEKLGPPPKDNLSYFRVGDEEVLVCFADGMWYAVSAICSHEDCNMADGFLENHNVVCPCHGSEFDVRTGDVLSLPAPFPIRSYRIKEEGESLWIEL